MISKCTWLIIAVIILGCIAACYQKMKSEEPLLVNLLDLSGDISIHEKQTKHPLSMNSDLGILKSGWRVTADCVQPTQRDPMIALKFDQVRDRIVRIGVKGEFPVQISGRAGENALIPNPSARGNLNTVHELIFPASFQHLGNNEIVLDFEPYSGCQVESITVLEGAARIGYAAVGEDIRKSLIALPEVTVGFKVKLHGNPNVLTLSTGLDDLGRRSGSSGGRISVKISDGTLIQENITRDVMPDGSWTPWEIPMDERFSDREVVIEFGFDPGRDGDSTGDILVIGDPEISGVDTLAAGAAGRPSIILITLDACRFDRLGFNGDSVIRSPALDKMARKGNVFSDCVCQINNTPPSHYTILTSKRPHTHGVYDMVTPLNPIHATLPRLLKPAGYRSAAATSAAWLSALTHGLGPGFERFYAPREAQRRGPVTFHALKPWLTDRARTSDSRPFFVWMHLFDAHTPLDPPPPYDQFYYSGNPRDPENHSMDRIGFSPEQLKYMRGWMKDVTDINYFLAQYRSEISYMDRVLEELRLLLAQTGAEKNTWVVITADHGISLDEHELYFIMAGMYEQQMHIPLVVIPPKGAQGNRVYTETVQSLDIAPTIMGIAGEPVPADFEGRNLLPLLQGGTIPRLEQVISEHANNRAVMIRNSRYKYIKYIRETYYHEPPIGLYDLSADCQELRNLQGGVPKVESDMDSMLMRFVEKPMGQADTGAADSEVLREKLKALGYVSE